jgi:hypothetical protein
LCVGAQAAVAEGEAGAYVEVAVPEVVQSAVFVAHLVCQPDHTPVRLDRKPRTRYLQRQGEVAAQTRELGHGVRFGAGAFGSDQAGQQVGRRCRVEDIQLDGASVKRCSDPGTAGNEYAAALTAWQQRFNLIVAGGVVEEYQDGAVGEQVAVQLGTLL